MYLAHLCCASDSGPYLAVDSVRQAQPPLSLLLLQFLLVRASLYIREDV
jgi:hypothetical protein